MSVVTRRIKLNNAYITLVGTAHYPKLEHGYEKEIANYDILAIELPPSLNDPVPLFLFVGLKYEKELENKYIANIDIISVKKTWEIFGTNNIIYYMLASALFNSTLFKVFGLIPTILIFTTYLSLSGIYFVLAFKEAKRRYEKLEKYFMFNENINYKEFLNLKLDNKLYIYIAGKLTPFPTIRDIGMAYSIWKLSEYFRKILVVTGAFHTDKIYRLLKNSEKLVKKFRKLEDKLNSKELKVYQYKNRNLHYVFSIPL